MSQSMEYTFGTNQTAADRLELVARFFNRHSRPFIKHRAAPSIATAVDLGCGPGFTTAMLRKTLRAERTVGLDNSQEFLDLAAERFGDCEFVRHDVTKAPLPVTSNLLYARFLLSHLSEPRQLIERWLDGLEPGGMLLIEELENIETAIPVFRRYLELNEALIASTGGMLYVGRELAAGPYAAKFVVNAAERIPVANAEAASWFYPNTVSVWNESDFFRDLVSPAERAEISAELAAIRDSNSGERDISWTMRQMALVHE